MLTGSNMTEIREAAAHVIHRAAVTAGYELTEAETVRTADGSGAFKWSAPDGMYGVPFVFPEGSSGQDLAPLPINATSADIAKHQDRMAFFATLPSCET